MVGIYEQPGSVLMTNLRKRVKVLDDLARHEHDLKENHQSCSPSTLHGINERLNGEVTVGFGFDPLELYAIERGVLLQYHVDGIELSSCADHPWLSWQGVQDGTQTLPR